ncbi:hypothetical protein ACN6LM_007527 [Streptomyces sp. SAS_281]
MAATTFRAAVRDEDVAAGRTTRHEGVDEMFAHLTSPAPGRR